MDQLVGCALQPLRVREQPLELVHLAEKRLKRVLNVGQASVIVVGRRHNRVYGRIEGGSDLLEIAEEAGGLASFPARIGAAANADLVGNLFLAEACTPTRDS